MTGLEDAIEQGWKMEMWEEVPAPAALTADCSSSYIQPNPCKLPKRAALSSPFPTAVLRTELLCLPAMREGKRTGRIPPGPDWREGWDAITHDLRPTQIWYYGSLFGMTQQNTVTLRQNRGRFEGSKGMGIAMWYFTRLSSF